MCTLVVPRQLALFPVSSYLLICYEAHYTLNHTIGFAVS